MLKRNSFIAVLTVLSCLLLSLLMPLPAPAAEFRWAEGITVGPMVGPGWNVSGENKGNGGTLNLYIGQLGGVHQGDWKILGVGGALLTVTSRLGGGTAYATSFVPATFFGDSLAPSVGWNWTDESVTFSIPVTLDVIQKLWE